MALRKLIIFVSSSIYVIAGLWFIVGFVWMFLLIYAPANVYNAQLLLAFFFTIAGNFLLWAGSRVSSRKDRYRKNPDAPPETPSELLEPSSFAAQEPASDAAKEQKPDF